METAYKPFVDIDNYDGGRPFELYQNLGIKTGNNFYNALNNIHEKTPLASAFFSRENIETIHEAIILGVYKASNNKYKIAKQSESSLEIVMRAMYLQHGKNNNENIDMQVKELDKIVVEYCVPNIMTNVTQYIGYINDIKKPPQIMDMPLDTSNKNKQLQPDVGFVKFQPYTQ